MNALTNKEEKIARISAATARGDLPNLKLALASGLDAGLTVNEIKEVLTQLYAYCGFPRSLNALGTFMALVNERGGTDPVGKLPGPLPVGRSLDFGTSNQTKLTGRPVEGPLMEFAPAIDEFLKAHLFGDIFARDTLDWKTRELATISALAAMDGVESQLKSHIAIGKHNGLTDVQIEAILALVHPVPVKTSAFPVGLENTGYAQYFSGKSWLAPLTQDKRLKVPLSNVTFEPGCRNNWHKHSGGQLLIVVGGVGYYQERGQPARRLVPGDVVEIPPDTEHWHGAAPDSWFSHLATAGNPDTNQNTWLEPVSEADYQAATGGIKVKVKAGTHVLTATFMDNATSRALIAKFPLTVRMMDLYSREVVHRFPEALPANETKTSGYEVGDVVYWVPRHSFVIMYEQNGERISDLQKIGRIDSGVEVFKRTGDIDVTFELLK